MPRRSKKRLRRARVGVGDNRCGEVGKFFATVVESTVVAKRCDLKHDDAEYLLRN